MTSRIGFPSSLLSSVSRRAWLGRTAVSAWAVTMSSGWLRAGGRRRLAPPEPRSAERMAQQSLPLDPGALPALQAIAQHAVETARSAGAQYVDAQLTRDVQHRYEFWDRDGNFEGDNELIGLGVRALVDGYWGFTASTVLTTDESERLARAAVAQARGNAKGKRRSVEMGQYPVVTGQWATPVVIDPFTIPVEEKIDYMEYWNACCARLHIVIDPLASYLNFSRQERVTATSDGSCVTQTMFESGGIITIRDGTNTSTVLQGTDVCGRGWERILDAKIPEQIATAPDQLAAIRANPARPVMIGRYTLVCDGMTMASLVEQTFGLATQLDRALGYEANASGTSYLDDPLAMVGAFRAASPLVTVTANRSAAGQLATVRWDAEGVEPAESTLVKEGILNDFQTTRAQAAWMAPYYTKQSHPVRSNGYAMSENALAIPMQQMPNLALHGASANSGLEDLIATVKDGILIVNGRAQVDRQARNGLLGSDSGEMRKITNGRLGQRLEGGAVQFNTNDLWRHVSALGGAKTEGVLGYSAYNFKVSFLDKFLGRGGKGQPIQLTSHSVSAPAAIIPDQPIINAWSKA